MKIKLKIFYLISLFFLLSPTYCLAKSIRIDNISYNVEDILINDNYVYNAIDDTLTLKNANLKSIKTTSDLKIILEGKNYLNNDDSLLDGISAKKIEIIGNGSLTINSKKRGIVGEKILINYTNININSDKDAICTSSNNNYDFIINNSNINIETKEEVFNIVSSDIYLNNSNIQIESAEQLTSSFGKYTYINNTNLNIKKIKTVNYNSYYIYVNGNSDLYVYATNNSYSSIRYKLGENLKILGSLDNLNYQPITETSKDKYIKITNNFNSIIEKEKELLKRITELDEKENNLLDLENKLIYDKKKLKELENDLEKRNIDIKIQEENLLKQINDNTNLKLDLYKKEEELKNVENNLIKEKEDIENVCQNIDLYNKESINNIENPKTYDNLLINIIVLIISMILIIFTIVIKKKEVLDG